MCGQGVTPKDVRVLAEIDAQNRFDPRICDRLAIDRFEQRAGVIDGHPPNRFGRATATVAIERNPSEKDVAIIIDVEIREYAVVLQAKGESTRPARHQLSDSQ